jgi:tetratricopeptide (TPR) repeat protein
MFFAGPYPDRPVPKPSDLRFFLFDYLGIMKYFAALILILFSGVAAVAQDSRVTPEERARAMEFFISGINDFENEDYERALDNLTAAHLKLSDDPGINYALSDVYLTMGDYSNAAYYARLAAEADPENKWFHLQLAAIYQQSGRTQATLQAFNDALKHHPNDADILFMKAGLFVDTGELKKANDVYDRILELRGEEFEIRLRKFQNYNALQMREEAFLELEKMREINPSNLSTLHIISQYYMELDNEDAARETLLDALERNPRDPQTLIMLAEIYINNREWENLGDTFITMLEDPLIYPSQKLELIRYIYSQHQRNPRATVLAEQTAEAVQAFSRNEPEYGPAQRIAAEFFIHQNQPEQALESLERAVEIDPSDADAWGQRIQTLFSLERYNDVIALSDEALEAVPDNAFLLFFTGASYMLTDRPEEAVNWLSDATEAPARRNFRSVIYGTLGDVKQDLDQWDEAVEAYEMALRLDRDNHNAMNNYAYFLSLRKERLDYAQELAERAVDMEPGNAAYLDTMGWVYFKQGNYEAAREYIQRSVDTGDASAEVYEHLGDVHEALGNPEQARQWWQKAFEMDPERKHLQEQIDAL